MLKHITWQQFLLAATLLTFLWYVAVMLLLYRKELKNFLTGKKNIAERNAEPPPNQTEEAVLPEENGNLEQDLMGKAKLPEGISIMGMDELRFKGKDDDKDRQFGNIPDLLEEMKQVFQIGVATFKARQI
ncbi:hypothetical protein H8S90_23820 [Olivibacter sp. SDN3]|uniref:hypothetical protein n=1 Tax=Olivibacter sp. SDN3 TaxID=2764720 RepID=UPI0016518264|nr:hypothetical protein [Olivibacter sp. SDN3]QNL49706.1 hypothetical protein H8S90_23820 [Olivibacter sp. SDN3]